MRTVPRTGKRVHATPKSCLIPRQRRRLGCESRIVAPAWSATRKRARTYRGDRGEALHIRGGVEKYRPPGFWGRTEGGHGSIGDDGRRSARRPVSWSVPPATAAKRWGYTTSKWRLSAHAEAYAILGNEAAQQIATMEGVDGDPRQADACLHCHTTGGGLAPTRGVQCESCHGPGSDHATQAEAGNPMASHAVGLSLPTRTVCEQCHSPGIHGADFDYGIYRPQVDHLAGRYGDGSGRRDRSTKRRSILW